MGNKTLEDSLSDEQSKEKTFLNEVSSLFHLDKSPKSSLLSVRSFKNNEDITFFGHLIREHPDSFIILYPAVVTYNSVVREISYLSSQPLLRYFKHQLKFVTLPSVFGLLSYLKESRNLYSNIPGYFTQERLDQIDILIMQLEMNLQTLGYLKPSLATTFYVKNDNDKYRH